MDGFIYVYGPGAPTSLGNSVYSSPINDKPLVYVGGLNAWLSSEGAQAYAVVLYIGGYGYYEVSERWIQSVSGDPLANTMVGGGDLTAHLFEGDTGAFSGTYVPVSSGATSIGSATYGANYETFTGLTNNAILIRCETDNGGYGSGLLGFQIVPIFSAKPIVGTPVANPNPAYGLSQLTLSDTVIGSSPITNQWQTNTDITGGLAGTWVNVPGANSTNLSLILPDGAYTNDFQFIASNGSGSVTSSVVAVAVQPSSIPVVSHNVAPSSSLLYSGVTATFTASFTGTSPITYQWQTDAGQTGTFTNIPLATGTTLTLTNVQPANSANYQLVATNSIGSGASSAASLVVLPALYVETFTKPASTNEPVSDVGWRNDITGSDGDIRLFSNRNGLTLPNGAVYSYDPSAADEAFYTTTLTENGYIAGQMPFPSIPVASATNLTFFVNIAAELNPTSEQSFFAVQMNGSNWYVDNSTPLTPSTSTFTNFSLAFNPALFNWNLLTLSGSGSFGNTNFPGVSAASPDNNLSGNITGAGVVCIHTGISTHDYQNFAIGGSIPVTTLPVINAEPASTTNFSGTTAVFEVAAATNESVAGLSFQWLSRAGSSGSFSNLNNGGQYNGSQSNTLSVSNLAIALNNQQEFEVVVTDGAGSVTSTPPAILTVVGAAPTISSDTTIAPNGVTAGNNNTVQMAASFTGSLPITYQWQFSHSSNGSGAVSVQGATNTTLALSIVSASQGGYYSLRASNGIGSPANSTWTQLTVAPASSAVYQWSAPVSFNGLTAAQILNSQPGLYLEAASFGGTVETVVVGSTTYNFTVNGSSATVSGGVGTASGAWSGTTGNANFDTVLNGFYYDGGVHLITLTNLTAGIGYTAQLFGLDDRGGGETSRLLSYQDPSNALDVSASYTEGGNYYIVGTFTATNTTMTIQQNLLTSAAGNINAVVVRTQGPVPTIQLSGSTLTVRLPYGTLLQATNVLGPWTTNTGTSPYTISTTNRQMYFQGRYP
jgi:hypothetical protein